MDEGPKDLTWGEFAVRLREAGWSDEEINEEIARLLTEEPESEL